MAASFFKCLPNFHHSIVRMLAYIGLGVAAFIVVIVATVVHSWYEYYLKTRNEPFENVPHDIFRAKVTPGGYDEASMLSPGPPETGERLLADGTVPAMGKAEALSNWGSKTSENCYRSDIGESLKKTRNFLQRTNNYSRTHPDSCTAPLHEFVGTFYTPANGVGNMPSSGTQMPDFKTYCKDAPSGTPS